MFLRNTLVFTVAVPVARCGRAAGFTHSSHVIFTWFPRNICWGDAVPKPLPKESSSQVYRWRSSGSLVQGHAAVQRSQCKEGGVYPGIPLNPR